MSAQRLAFLLETVELEAAHLQGTDARLFAVPFTAQRAATLQPALLADAVNAAHESIAMLVGFATACTAYAHGRGLTTRAARGG